MLYANFYVHSQNEEEKKEFRIGMYSERVCLDTRLGPSTMSTQFTLEEARDLAEKLNAFLFPTDSIDPIDQETADQETV